MSDTREEKFNALYDSTRPLIIAYALRRTTSPEDAADIVAEIFEIAWRRFDDVPPGHAAVLWLYVTARYVLANHGRRLRRQDAVTARLAEELKGVPMRVEAMDEDAVVMRSCLQTLRADEREVLMLAGWEGLGASDIARILGCSPTAVRIRLFRARTRLRDEMSGRTTHQKQFESTGHEQGGAERENSLPEEALEQ